MSNHINPGGIIIRELLNNYKQRNYQVQLDNEIGSCNNSQLSHLDKCKQFFPLGKNNSQVKAKITFRRHNVFS